MNDRSKIGLNEEQVTGRAGGELSGPMRDKSTVIGIPPFFLKRQSLANKNNRKNRIMNQLRGSTNISLLTELDKVLQKASDLWHGTYNLGLVAKIELATEKTGIDTTEGYISGAMTQVCRPVMYIEYNIWNNADEGFGIENEHLTVLDKTFKLDNHNLKFHIAAIKSLLIENAPTKEEWDKAVEEQKSTARAEHRENL